MATDYGTDIAALDDLPDPEVLATGELNRAYALGRRLLTPADALEEIGDTAPYDSMDLRAMLGRREGDQEFDDVGPQAEQVLLQDPTVDSVVVSAAFGAGALTVTARGTGKEGPFSLILKVDAVTAKLLLEEG